MSETRWTGGLSPKQAEVRAVILEADPGRPYTMISGAQGSGKTYVAAPAFLQSTVNRELDSGGYRQVVGVCSYQKRMIEDTLLPNLVRHLIEVMGYEATTRTTLKPRQFRFNRDEITVQNLAFTFHAGEGILSANSVKGRNWLGVYLDEATDLDPDFIEEAVVGRVREGGGEEPEDQCVFVMNPKSYGHSFYENWWANPRIEQYRRTFTMGKADNPAIAPARLERQRLSYRPGSPAYVNHFLGEWTTTAVGAVFKHFTQGEPPDNKPWSELLTFDYAPHGKNAALYAVQRGEREWWSEDEWAYDSRFDGESHMRSIAGEFKEWIGSRQPAGVLIDGSAERDFKLVLAEVLGLPIINAFNGRLREEVHERERPRATKTRVAAAYLEEGVIKIKSGACPQLVSDLLRAEYDPAASARGEAVPVKRSAWDDHHADALMQLAYTLDYQHSPEKYARASRRRRRR